MIGIDIATKHWQELKGGRGLMNKKYLYLKGYVYVHVDMYIYLYIL